MFVCDRMSSPAVTITPETRLQAAQKLMHEHRSVIEGQDMHKDEWLNSSRLFVVP